MGPTSNRLNRRMRWPQTSPGRHSRYRGQGGHRTLRSLQTSRRTVVRRAYRERSAHLPATRLALSAPDRQEHPLSRSGPETIRSVGRRRWCLRNSRRGPELGAVKPAEIRSRFLSGPLRRFQRHTGRAIGRHHPGTGALGLRVKRPPRPNGSDGRATRPVTKVGRSADSHRPVASPAAARS